jgi:transcriptional regulator
MMGAPSPLSATWRVATWMTAGFVPTMLAGMYSPPENRLEAREQIIAFMQANGFAMIVTADGGVPTAAHLPVTVTHGEQGIVLHSHMAKRNPQWKQLASDEILVVFAGPHAYVSPRWYEDEERVPTWNYAAVHAYGTATVIEDPTSKHAAQRKLVATLDPQWLPRFDALRPEYVQAMLGGIVAFEVAVTRLETRWKLSQSRGRREQERIAAELDASDDASARALAILTRMHLVSE